MTDTDKIRAAWGSYDHHVPTPWEDVADLCDALDRCRKLVELWASMPGSSHGLPANCMTNDCAAFWLDAAITGEEVLP